jgi:hypothetical protein
MIELVMTILNAVQSGLAIAEQVVNKPEQATQQTQSFQPEIRNILANINQQPPQAWSTDKAYQLLQMLRQR